MVFDSNKSRLLNQCFKSRVRDWGGSKGLLIPNSLNFPKGPVVLVEDKNKLEVIFVGDRLPAFIKFVKNQISGVLKDSNGKVVSIDSVKEIHIKRILVAVEALEQRALASPEETNDSDAARELFGNIAATIKKHLELFLNSAHLTSKIYHLTRLSDELDYAVKALDRVL
ncbi:MAG: hypothetical protein OdinLCB4_000130 [Candidatus Odinarchaeum yellowstonii]|uniref:Uncharacterized protein n=1 Tax=Odinarchaeota yellowstonii (strain LCB_4) TaxID=1841599 RepID=A0AAF0D293_ODILC|nr:MAG: hypothetical protein OdinLCB4_000130 [Candidatus Odinarchaeum yellowstonii]